MHTAKIIFKKCHQNFQEIGSNDEHMISRIFFDSEIGDKNYENLCVDIKQVVGGNFEQDPLEVIINEDFPGQLNYEKFRAEAEKYYRELIGKEGKGIKISGGKNIILKNNIFEISKTVLI